MKIQYLILAFILCGCSIIDPNFERSGGKFYGAANPRFLQEFDPSKFAHFKVGKTTKDDVLRDLGRPYGWHNSDEGVLHLHYRYAGTRTGRMTRMVFPNFFFENNILVRMNNTTWDEVD